MACAPPPTPPTQRAAAPPPPPPPLLHDPAPAMHPSDPAPPLVDAHGDDSYCALCRRCQMRKKLERRLAQKKGNGDPDCPSQHEDDLDRAGDRTHHEQKAVIAGVRGPPQDLRPLDELLLFIGEGSKQQPRKPRKKRITRAARKQPQAVTANVTCSMESHPDPLHTSCGSIVTAASAPTDSGAAMSDRSAYEEGDGHPLSTSSSSSPASHPSSPGHHEQRNHLHEPGCDSPVSDDAQQCGHLLFSPISTHHVAEMPNRQVPTAHARMLPLPFDADASLCDLDIGEEMTREEQEAIDQEVEEFRLCLESVCSSPSVVRQPVSF